MAGKALSSDRHPSRAADAGASALRRMVRGGLVREVIALSLLLGVAFLVLSLASFDPADSAANVYPHNATPSNLGGHFGAMLVSTSYLYFGVATYLMVSLLGIWAGVVFFRRNLEGWPLKLLGACLAVMAFASFFGASMQGSVSMPSSGGVVGTVIFDLLSGNFGLTGTYLILVFVVAVSSLLATDILFYPLLKELFAPRGGDDYEDVDSALGEAGNEDGAAEAQGKRDDGLLQRVFGKEKKGRKRKTAKTSEAETRMVAAAIDVELEEDITEDIEEDDEEDSTAESALRKAVEDDDSNAQPMVFDVALSGAAAPALPPRPKRKKLSKELIEKLRRRIEQEAEAYQSPSAELLEPGRKADSFRARREVENSAQLIVDTLKHFTIDVEVLDIKRGPTVSMYELRTPPNLPLKKVESREQELSMMLQASMIRILAPIPGRNTVGVEVPNRVRDTVSLREVLSTPDFLEASKKMQLPMALGLDSEGKPLIHDLAKSPHLLVAGTTGSGKSVVQNVMLMSLLMSRHYHDVRLLLVDPKCVELTPYQELPFLAMPVITDMTKAVAAFEWLVEEMEQRYDLFAKTRTKKITEFNALSIEERKERVAENGGDPAQVERRLPYIVAMVDELADMMMVNAETRVDELICRIAQKARAAGIHMILSTQRPSADVITGLIKANIPARITFKLPTAVDSRTIISAMGAEKLLGAGDMLIDWNDGKGLSRAQSAFTDTPEIDRVCAAIKAQATPNYLTSLKKVAAAASVGDDMIGGQLRHEKLDEAVEQVLATGRASAQFLRSALRIGYSAATTIVMQMEMLGILGQARGSKEREILMTLDEWRALQNSDDGDDDDAEIDGMVLGSGVYDTLAEEDEE